MNPEPSDLPSPAPGDDTDADELLPEYDLTGGERGHYTARFAEGTNLVRLDPDVAAAFPDPTEVNAVLRAVAGIIQRHGTEPGPERRSA